MNRNSQNYNQPFSADEPFKKPQHKSKKAKHKRGGQKGHTGHLQKMLESTDTIKAKPELSSFGNRKFNQVEPFCTHQGIELQEIELEITHFVFHKGCCTQRGQNVSARLEPVK